MKIQNVGLDNAYAIVRGWVGPNAAAGTGLISINDGTTTGGPATSLEFSGLTVTDVGGGIFLISTTWKIPVRVATTVAGTLASSFENGDTVDGIVLATGDRILIKDQAAGAENGIYVVNITGAPERSPDMDDSSEVLGAVIYVIDGTANATSIFVATNTTEPTLGTDVITFASINSVIPAGTFELAIEGGQSVIKAHGSMGATETFDPTDGNVHTGTLNANCTFTLNAPTGSGAATLEFWLTEDSTGAWTVTWPGSVTEQGVHDTTASTTQRVVLETVDGGSTWIATWIGNSAITIKDEGTPLATAATSLDFVGAGVTASGSGAAKTITIPNQSVLTTKGDIWGYSSVNARIPVGADGTVVTADSTAALGVSYQTPAAIGPQHVHVNNVTFSGDGATTVFELPAAPVDEFSIGVYIGTGRNADWVLSGGLLTTLTFGSAPTSGTNNVSVDIAAALL